MTVGRQHKHRIFHRREGDGEHALLLRELRVPHGDRHLGREVLEHASLVLLELVTRREPHR